MTAVGDHQRKPSALSNQKRPPLDRRGHRQSRRRRHERFTSDCPIAFFAVRKKYDDGQVDAAAAASEREADWAPAEAMEKAQTQNRA